MTQHTDTLSVHAFPLGPYETNCYILHAAGPDCWIIDAGYQPHPLLQHLREHKLAPSRIILTHAHFDHIAGLPELRDAYPDIPVHLHDAEHDWLADPTLNLSAMIGMPMTMPAPDASLPHGQILTLDNITFEIRHTPGHSPGGVALIAQQQRTAVVGDTLFNHSIGRSDFPTSDPHALIQSIQQQLYTLPDDTIIHPGHGPQTTIGQEKQANPFVRPTT